MEPLDRCPYCDTKSGEVRRLQGELQAKAMDNINLHLALLQAEGKEGSLITPEMRAVATARLLKARGRLVRLACYGDKAGRLPPAAIEARKEG